MNGHHIDAYRDYNFLVGEADGGSLLPQREYDKLRALAQRIHDEGTRLYVYWRNKRTLMECYCVGPDSRCFCGHSYKGHAWYEVESRKVHCRAPGCRCGLFRYVNGRGSQFLKCDCKHGHEDHRTADGRMTRCHRCACKEFFSHWSCACGSPWVDHETVFQPRAERVASGLQVDNVGQGGAAIEAACGGVTRFTSLVSGIERPEASLPFTDGANSDATVPYVVPGTFPAKMLEWDKAADAAASRRARMEARSTQRAQRTRTSTGHRLGTNGVTRSTSSRRPTREEMREKAAAAAERRLGSL